MVRIQDKAGVFVVCHEMSKLFQSEMFTLMTADHITVQVRISG